MELAAKTWTGEWWLGGGGGTVWDSMAYDPELDPLYVGTGNGSPWARAIRSPGGGDNLFLSSIVALNPDTGASSGITRRRRRRTGTTRRRSTSSWRTYALGGKVAQGADAGAEERLLLRLDRVTGELLSADKYIPTTWATHVDMKTGRPVETPEADWSKETRILIPAQLGGHNWHPMAFNPQTGLVYIPAMQPAGIYPPSTEFQQTGKYTRREMFWNPGVDWNNYANTIYAMVAQLGELPKDHGYLKAWDPVAKKTRWEIEHPAFWNGGLLTTAGNLLVQGTGDGRLVAYAADSGKILWAVPTLVGIVAPPVTYAVDGEQYIAVMAGYGGAGAVTAGDPRTMASAKYFNEGHVLAFKLGGKATMPRIAERNLDIPEPPRPRCDRRADRERQERVRLDLHGLPRAAGDLRWRGAGPAARCRQRSTRSSSRSSTTGSSTAPACRAWATWSPSRTCTTSRPTSPSAPRQDRAAEVNSAGTAGGPPPPLPLCGRGRERVRVRSWSRTPAPTCGARRSTRTACRRCWS